MLAVAVAVGATALAKLLLWPLVVWLVATRRLRAAATALGLACVLTIAFWALIGFEALTEYPAVVRVLSDVQTWKAYSVAALVSALGAPHGAIVVLTAALVVVGVAAVLVLGRRRQGDRLAFGGAIAVGLVASPILWQHYLILLFAPIALARPKLSALWFAPLVFWVSPNLESLGSIWRICVVLALTVWIVLLALTPRRGDSVPAVLGRGRERPSTA